ncbi:MAG: glucose-1-phosphate cytidylyltransferase, partial [Desulfobacteraceae bacterium]|nr:glucose-1-phosphate cytidylyltransferase [Desulfobacteraceae bacterium]
MPVVILCGGHGTRISEESATKPKPMIEIGARPILWHIMKIYSHYGFNEFIICLGHKGYVIKEYFAHYFLHESDVTFDFTLGNQQITHGHRAESWKVTLVNTGENTMTGGRIKRIQRYVKDETFMLTYGDGVSDVDIRALLEFHRTHGRTATLTAVKPQGRFGVLDLGDEAIVRSFKEKVEGNASLINGGFFVLEPAVFDLLQDDSTVFERAPLESLASSEQLKAYKHDGFWYAMDKLSDKIHLDNLWSSGSTPWKVWDSGVL